VSLPSADLLKKSAVVNFVVPLSQLVGVDSKGTKPTLDAETCPKDHFTTSGCAIVTLLEQARVSAHILGTWHQGLPLRKLLGQLGHRLDREVRLFLVEIRFGEFRAFREGVTCVYLVWHSMRLPALVVVKEGVLVQVTRVVIHGTLVGLPLTRCNVIILRLELQRDLGRPQFALLFAIELFVTLQNEKRLRLVLSCFAGGEVFKVQFDGIGFNANVLFGSRVLVDALAQLGSTLFVAVDVVDEDAIHKHSFVERHALVAPFRCQHVVLPLQGCALAFGDEKLGGL